MLAKNPTWTIIKPQVCRWQWGSCTWNNPLRCSQNRKHRRLKQKKKTPRTHKTKTQKKTDTHTLPAVVFCSITCCFGQKFFESSSSPSHFCHLITPRPPGGTRLGIRRGRQAEPGTDACGGLGGRCFEGLKSCCFFGSNARETSRFAGKSVWANYRKNLEGNLGGIILAHFKKNGPTAILEAILEIIQECFWPRTYFRRWLRNISVSGDDFPEILRNQQGNLWTTGQLTYP